MVGRKPAQSAEDLLAAVAQAMAVDRMRQKDLAESIHVSEATVSRAMASRNASSQLVGKLEMWLVGRRNDANPRNDGIILHKLHESLTLVAALADALEALSASVGRGMVRPGGSE